jgi:prephenate dehydrogenase
MPRLNTVAIVGVGLIGGSIGLAVRDRKLATHIVGIGRRAPTLKKAKELGAITFTCLNIEQGVAEADIVIVCTPVSDIAGHILQAAVGAPKSALLTDAGSTKRKIVADVEAAVGADKRFVGSHPLAGSEKAGVEFARADLFDGKVVVVTPTQRTANGDMQAVADFWSGLGASVLVMTPDAHDKALASTSHLPHLIASAVAAKTAQVDLPVTAGGWRDVTRVAAGDPELWTQILLENREHVLKSLTGFEKTVAAFRAALERGDRRKLHQLLTEGKQVRDAVGN